MEKIKTRWEVWTYDVWGNEDEGYVVNDRFRSESDLLLRLKVQTFNPNTSYQFFAASPNEKQIRDALALGSHVKLFLSVDDVHIYVDRYSDRFPLGELICVSDDSLEWKSQEELDKRLALDRKIECSCCGGPTEFDEGSTKSEWYLCQHCVGTKRAEEMGYTHNQKEGV